MGNLDLKLTKLGACQAQNARSLLRSLGVLHTENLRIISSPYLRAAQTAIIISKNQSCTLLFDERLKERNLDYKNPEAEKDFYARINSFLSDRFLSDKMPPTIICAHALVFKAFLDILNIHPSVEIKMAEVAKFTQVDDSTWEVRIIKNVSN